MGGEALGVSNFEIGSSYSGVVSGRVRPSLSRRDRIRRVVDIDEYHNADFGGDASECHEANGDRDRHVEAERPSPEFAGNLVLVLNGLLNRSP